MFGHSNDERVLLVVPGVEWTLRALRVVVPVMGIALVAVRYSGIFETVLTASTMVTVLCISVVLLYLAIANIPSLYSPAERIASGIKRWLVIRCKADCIQRSLTSTCPFVARELRRPWLADSEQKSVVNTLITSIEDESVPNFAILLGKSGTGKTRTFILLLKTLVDHAAHFPLADRAYYFDLSRGGRIQARIQRLLGSPEYENGIVVIDNFHLAGPKLVAQTTHYLLDLPGKIREKLVLLVAQPPNNWRLCPSAEVRLLTEAARTGQLFELPGLSRHMLRKSLQNENDVRTIEALASLQKDNMASISEIRFAEISKGSTTVPPVAKDMFDLLAEDTPQIRHPSQLQILRILAIASALALQTGSFTSGEFRRAAWSATPYNGLHRAWLWLCCLYGLRNMARAGIIPRTTLPGRVFVVHEAFAERIRDSFRELPAFERSFQIAMRWRLQRNKERRDPILQWIGGCELTSIKRLDKWFDSALLQGGLRVMHKSLSRNLDYMDFKPVVKYQLGVIQDKLGSFEAARSNLTECADDESASADQRDRAMLALIEAEHGESNERRLRAAARKTKDDFSRIAVRYWGIHLDAHRGRFSFSSLRELITELSHRTDDRFLAHSYEWVHLAARVFYDGCRHAHLEGINVQDRLSELRREKLHDFLSVHYSQNRAMSLLYFQAHIEGHLNLPVSMSVVNFDSDAVSGGGIRERIQAARQIYKQAQAEFAIYGDREYRYLEADLINLDIQDPDSDLDELQVRLSQYADFISDAVVEIASYPHLYWFRWHVAKRFRCLLSSDEEKDDVEWHDREAARRLQLARNLDLAVRNQYGLWRIDFLSTLSEAFHSGSGRSCEDQILKLSQRAAEHGYHRDAAIASRLLRSGAISVDSARKCLMYYPIVHQ